VSLIFAILGVSLFSGLFHRCNNPAATGYSTCRGSFIDPETGLNTTSRWANPVYAGVDGQPAYSFDNIGQAFLTVTEIMNVEGFIEVMGAAMDTTMVGEQPRANASPLNCLFFVLAILVGNFFISNVYAGVVIQSYSRSDGTAFMTPEQREWVNAKLIVRGAMQTVCFVV
jgi:hypothetical protein